MELVLILDIDSSSCQSDTVFYLPWTRVTSSKITSFINYLLIWQNYARVMFKWDKSLFELLVGQDSGQSPYIVNVPLKSGQLATMENTSFK